MKLEASLKHFSPQDAYQRRREKHITESPERNRRHDRDRGDQQSGAVRSGGILR